MQLHEAIRLGSMLTPQIFGDVLDVPIFHVTLMGEDIAMAGSFGTCALGAAAQAIGMLPTYEQWNSEDDIFVSIDCMRDIFPVFSSGEYDCPVGSCDTQEKLIPHLNDDHRWSREAIADWIETIEPKEAPTVVAETEEVRVGR